MSTGFENFFVCLMMNKGIVFFVEHFEAGSNQVGARNKSKKCMLILTLYSLLFTPDSLLFQD
jgi:hypothetical protein